MEMANDLQSPPLLLVDSRDWLVGCSLHMRSMLPLVKHWQGILDITAHVTSHLLHSMVSPPGRCAVGQGRCVRVHTRRACTLASWTPYTLQGVCPGRASSNARSERR